MKNKNIKLRSLLIEQDTENYIADSVKAVNAKLKELGLKPAMKADHFEGEWHTIEKGTVDSRKLGPLAGGFDGITYEVEVGGSPDGKIAKIVAAYQWTHPTGGSNGITSIFTYNADRKRWN